MKRIAILGGGISGLTAAYELELARKRGADIDWHLYEATDHLGGIVETTRHTTPEGEWILEGGPDAWVSEKPWARELAEELGLGSELIYSTDADRKTYILIDGQLHAMPDRMRMFVPEDLSTLEASPLFSAAAKQAYADEVTRAEELKSSAPTHDESVASFVRRHFGDEVLEHVAAPLLSGIFGGDVHKLSARSVLAPFVKMEQEHGSLILALQRKSAERGNKPPNPTFTSLRRGMGSLGEALVATLPTERLHLRTRVKDIGEENHWSVVVGERGALFAERFDNLVLATPLEATRELLHFDGDHSLLPLLPLEASSAVLVTFCWTARSAALLKLPQGFGFLVPQHAAASHTDPVISTEAAQPRSGETPVSAGASAEHEQVNQPSILAATFTNQKFPHRAPRGARAIRVYFGADSTEHFANTPDADVAKQAFEQLQAILGPLPAPDEQLTTVRRWPYSLPQYEVGHLDRMAQLDNFVSEIPGLRLLGNSYRGVGLPDLIHAAREIARKITN